MSKVVVLVAVALVCLVAGFAAGYAMGDNNHAGSAKPDRWGAASDPLFK